MNAVHVRDITHSFPSKRAGENRTVLADVNLAVAPGELFGLLGPNGGGKTTLFRILCTLLMPSRGSASLFGTDIVQQPQEARRKIGVVFQNPSLDKKLTLFENLTHQGHLYGLSGHDLRARATKLLETFSLNDRRDDEVEILSGGMQRRGEIAKGLLHKPLLLLMDEPSTGLDPGARREMWDNLLQLKKEGVTIMITTHLREEGDKCDRLAIINQGRLVALGTPAELKKKIGGDVVTVQTPQPAELAHSISQKFGHKAAAMGETVRIEIVDGHKFIPILVEAFPGLITAVTVGKPTLEDVFVHETGQRFYEAPRV